MAGEVHGHRARARHQDGARDRRQRDQDERAHDDHHGRRHQPLVPRRHRLPHDHQPPALYGLRGTQRRRLGALRRAGEAPSERGLGAHYVGLRLAGSAEDAELHVVLLFCDRPVAQRRDPDGRARGGKRDGALYASGGLRPARGTSRLGPRLSDVQPRLEPDRRRREVGGLRGRGRHQAVCREESEGRQPRLCVGGPRCTPELPAQPLCLALQPPRLVREGQRLLPQVSPRHGEQHLPGGGCRRPSAGGQVA